jgi:hypothetical protein
MHKMVMLCLLLGGCAEYQAKVAAAQAARDDAKCISYGATLGDPAYVQCRAQLDAARTQAAATEAAAPGVNFPAPSSQSPSHNPFGLAFP